MKSELNERYSMTIYRLLKLVVRIISRIPLRIGQFCGRMLGRAFAMIIVRRTKVSLDNLRKVFGNQLDEDEIKRLNIKVAMHFGQMLFEVPHILRLNHANLDRYVLFENEQNLLKAIEKEKGVFMLTAHFGNWELMSVALSLKFAPDGAGAIVVRPIDFLAADILIRDLRSRFGTKIIPKQHGIRSILRAIKENKIVGILLDQNMDWYEGVFVPFLGLPACTNKGLALMAYKTKAPVIPAFSVREADGRYRIIFEKEVDLIRTGDKTRDIEENTAFFTKIIERYVRQYPDQWFWFHKRWKTKPFCQLPDTGDMTYAESSSKKED